MSHTQDAAPPAEADARYSLTGTGTGTGSGGRTATVRSRHGSHPSAASHEPVRMSTSPAIQPPRSLSKKSVSSGGFMTMS